MITPTSVRCAVVTGIFALGLATDLSGQAAPPDAWTMVPALPTTCFVDDGFSDRLSAAITAIQAEVERQTKVNDDARERFDNMDMTEKAQRMQAFMMKNPQAAARMMQAEQAAGAAAATSLPEAQAAVERLEAELQRLETSFGAAADRAVAPIKTRQQQLIDTKTV